ncbi:MAG: hypothetical protein IJJ38_05565 [Lachnospiraceae bacterium]|nr:hypothetical protein [Lachnospiraceae bacterium]
MNGKPELNRVVAYVDGSYQESVKTYAYGCVLFAPDGTVRVKSDRGSNADTAAIRNVAGEMLGAMVAVQWAMKNGYPAIEIRYDYQGIEMWAAGKWKAKNELTRKYAETMKRWGQTVRISFSKVKAHSGDRFNDLADQLAKEALEGRCRDFEILEGEELPAAPPQQEEAEMLRQSGTEKNLQGDAEPAARGLEAALRKLADSDMYPFHMPGHKRRTGPESRLDITEIDGFDDLHHPEGILREEMEAAARLFGAEETYFLVNGSTCGILAAISAAVPRGGTILIERSCHISVYHAAELMDLHIRYTGEPGSGPDSPEGVQAVVITSPSYEGCVKDVRSYADAAHAAGAVLIVDEAHGAHLPLMPEETRPFFPACAAALGADLVVESAHKTLPCLTQTAFLHNVSGRVPGWRLRKYLDIYETSSPSYLLLASVTGALHAFSDGGDQADSGRKQLVRYAGALRELRAELSGLRFPRLAGGADGILTEDGEIPGYRAGTKLDPGKLVLLTEDADALYRALRENCHIQPEMKAPGYVLLMTSYADSAEGFSRLLSALREIDAAGRAETASSKKSAADTAPSDTSSPDAALPARSLPSCAMTISGACMAESELIPFADAAGRISGDYVAVFPPDTPLIVPGEIFDEDLISRAEFLLKRGYSLTGCDGGRVRVLVR